MAGWRSSPVVWVSVLLAAVAVALLLPRLALIHTYAARITTLASAPTRTTAIVFGAGLRRDGTPTLVLADRVAAAAALYHQGKVRSLLLSGSSRGQAYDEAEAMRGLAVRLGVNPQAILVDRQGTRTMETCLRARQAFGIRSAVLVTQRFHLPRALALCEAVGIEADGVQADLSRYSTWSRSFWQLREFPACLAAMMDAARARSIFRLADERSASDSGAPHES